MTTAFESLRAQEIMTRSLVCAAPDDSLADAEALLIEHRIGGMPVVADGKLIGVISRSDVARVQVLMNSLDGLVNDRFRQNDETDGFVHASRPEFQSFRETLPGLRVRDAMHDQVATCAASASAVDVAHIMLDQHVHRVIVVEADRPIGIISSLDLVRLTAGRES
jgi:CBS domain-containing protein